MIYDRRTFKCNKSPVKDREHASRIFVFIMILKRPPKIKSYPSFALYRFSKIHRFSRRGIESNLYLLFLNIHILFLLQHINVFYKIIIKIKPVTSFTGTGLIRCTHLYFSKFIKTFLEVQVISPFE